MSNPLLIAIQGKGFFPMLARGQVIAGRYGLTPRKMDDAFAAFTGDLGQFSCSATFPVTASSLDLNPSFAKKCLAQGLELAVHGLQHIDYSLLSAEEQANQLGLARAIFQKLGLPLAGFRCPYLRWNTDTINVLREAGFLYDSSQALAWDVEQKVDTDDYLRVLDFYQAQPAREVLSLPAWADGLIRIPYGLPDDEALVDRLHITDPAKMAEIWLSVLGTSYRLGELFVLGLHPERYSLCQEALRVVLKKALSFSPAVWIARLDEIARWYLALGQATFQHRRESGDFYHLHLDPPPGAVVLARGVKVMASTLPWAFGYETVSTNEFTVQSSKMPWIGLSPNTPISLQRFLRHQGFLIEVSADPQNYTCYLDHTTFNRQDERSLLSDIEKHDRPLVRLSRWPNGAQSGLAITGDVDAFTIWDFGRRIFAR